MSIFFGVVALIILLALGLSLIAGGIVWLVINRKRGHFRLRWLCNTIATFLLIFGLAVTAFPAGFFGMIAMSNILPPDDFVKTDIVIEEIGYQDTQFTAAGVTYLVLPFDAEYEGCAQAATPVFTYYAGIFGGRECGNYYRLPSNFDLIWDGSSLLFCPQAQYDAVVNYYRASPVYWYDITAQTPRSLTVDGELEQILSEQAPSYDLQSIEQTDYPEEYYITGRSQDGYITYFFHTLLLIDGRYYLCHASMFGMDDGYYHFDVAPLPQAVSDELHSKLAN